MYISRKKKLLYRCYSFFYGLFYDGLHSKRRYISPFISVDCKKNVSFGHNSRVESKVHIEARGDSKVQIGKNAHIHSYSRMITYGGMLKIGDFCSVHPWVMIGGPGDVTIGNYVRIATHVTIVAGNHIFADPNEPIHKQGMSKESIVIEDDCWLAANSVILGGVTVREGCVIGAGAVVNKDTEPYGVYVGVPARRVGDRKL